MAHQNNTMPLLGAHMSINGGLEQAIIEADKLGCTAVQFFSKSNRQWHAKPLTDDTIAQFQQATHQSSIRSITVHASYLINIGSPDKRVSVQATAALQEELLRAQQLRAHHLVFHPGSHKQEGEELCLKRIADTMNIVLAQTDASSPTKLLLETMAGQGSSVGHTFEQLAYILGMIEQKDRVGVCIDTCHIFAAGYDIRSKAGYETVISQFDVIIGLNNLYAIHINDSKKECGSRVDRHEHIGKGALGLEPFGYIINDTRLQNVPKILETPKDAPDDDRNNLQVIRGLIRI